ncbi:hypothetical protein PR001_g25805 [Phytophthora rubi]|uniref:Uncharacterized protein n=1 Tax=Phytophthora rubi TaxID=129364 RepID=A0A6A3I4V7_9STRA|nr:hypothetical protein PR001_g25805 [Phytophthora rubi]
MDRNKNFGPDVWRAHLEGSTAGEVSHYSTYRSGGIDLILRFVPLGKCPPWKVATEGKLLTPSSKVRGRAAVVSSSVAEAGDGVCTVDFKLQLSGSRYVLAVACMAGVEVFVLTVPMYVAFVWHSGNGASGGVQTAAAKQRISGTWCVLVVACMASVEVFALTVLMSMACV